MPPKTLFLVPSSELTLVRSIISQDLDGSGKIRWTEFVAAALEAHGSISEDKLAEAFDRIDADDSGYITADNLIEMLGEEFPKEECLAIIKEADILQDGKICYGEFLALWGDHQKEEPQEIIKEITVTTASNRSWGSDRSVNISVLSADDSEETRSPKADSLSRASFVEGKMMSERNASMVKIPKKLPMTEETTESTLPVTESLQTLHPPTVQC